MLLRGITGEPILALAERRLVAKHFEGVADLIMNMRARMAQCRLLAQHTTDTRTAKILRQMADEVEKDIERLEQAKRGPPLQN